MKYTKVFVCLIIGLFFTSCIQPGKYTGAKYPSTKSVEVFHSAAEIKRPYKVIGHLVNCKYRDKENEQIMMMDAKRVGGDAVILLGVDSTITGKPNRITADVIKYDDK